MNVLVMDLLGDSLHTLFINHKTLKKQPFSLKTVLMVADQVLQRLEFVHGMRVIHRDIKPGNLTIGYGKTQHKVFLIDFGLAKKYKSQNGKHISLKNKKELVGTARYCSMRTSEGVEPSRRDDIETLFNVMVYFLKGELPW